MSECAFRLSLEREVVGVCVSSRERSFREGEVVSREREREKEYCLTECRLIVKFYLQDLKVLGERNMGYAQYDGKKGCTASR